MILEAVETLPDRSITLGQVYTGHFIYCYPTDPGLRAVVYNNQKIWKTYKPDLFRPFIVKIASMEKING